MPARHSTPASPPATQQAASGSHGSPAAASSAEPSRATPRVAMRTTVPGKPSSATTRFEPPASTSGGWPWLRDSGLVAVDKVSVTGLSGTEAPRVRAALEGAARDMTTLHVRPGQLRTAVEPYPAIMAVDAHPDFPHGLRIVVHEHVAVAALAAGSDRVPVAADGTLLR